MLKGKYTAKKANKHEHSQYITPALSSRMTNSVSLILGSLVISTFLSGLALSSSLVLADDVIDHINLAVPVACTMSGTGQTSHNANINNGIYTADIGTTTLHALCNDSEGFAIYAAGYTGNEVGETNSNKLVGTSASNNATIETGLATTAGNPDVSNWAMKLTATQDSGDTTGTNAFTIDSAPNTSGGADDSFSQYHVVPNEYTKVAHKNSNTDMADVVGGVKLTTTYAAYISKTQPADTYSGQVIYTLVHPATAPEPVGENQIGVNYIGNGLSFTGNREKNRVIYGPSCTTMYEATEPTIAKTSNVAIDGTKNSAYTAGEAVLQTLTYNDAVGIKVVIEYGITGIAGVVATAGTWTFDDPIPEDAIVVYSGTKSDTATFNIEGNTVTVAMLSYTTPESGYDYGIFAQVYPIYATQQTGTEEISVCSDLATQTGTYVETTTWKGKWYITNNGEIVYFENEAAVINYLKTNSAALLGTTINIYAYNPYTIYYDGNGSTVGTMANFYTTLETNTVDSVADLMAYNFKKAGYGFAGWSENQNATVDGSNRIYGPNEMITGDELTFDSNTHNTTLYAVWVQSAGNLQSWAGCSSMQNGQVTALTDTRDNNVYAIGKYADGNCWMMENIRLDAANSTDMSKAQGFGGVFTGLADSEDANFISSTASNSKYSTSNITGMYLSTRFPRYNNNNTNMGGTNATGVSLIISPGIWNGAYYDIEQDNSGNTDHNQWYSYGNYYTWAAAMANTTEVTTINASESTNTSICPTGWQLPYGRDTGNGTTSGGFSYLDIQLGGTGSFRYATEASKRWREYPINYIYSGSYVINKATDRGLRGNYWSTTIDGDSGGYLLGLDSTGLSPGTGSASREIGYAVRCLTQ